MPDHADLTQPIEDGMQTYPGDPPVSLSDHTTHAADGYHVESLSCGSHTGTHIDAPLTPNPTATRCRRSRSIASFSMPFGSIAGTVSPARQSPRSDFPQAMSWPTPI